MTGNEILKSDLLDILFDNRNKQYGAYILRKYYSNRLILSLAIALSTSFLLFLFFNSGITDSAVVQKPNDEVSIRELVMPEKKEIKIEPPKPTVASSVPSAATRVFVNRINIVDNDHVIKQKMTANNELDSFAIADFNLPGTPGGPKISQVINTSGGGSGKQDVKTSEAPLINSSPEFPGGMKAWVNFLNRNLQTPGELQPGEKKTVLIKFDVAIDGAVTGFHVVQSGGEDYDREVIRVLKKMPKWKPAMQNSQPVAISFNQPVTFVGLED